MGRSRELTEFERGTVIGCHRCNKSVRQISSILHIPRSTVSAIIDKWKRLGTIATQPRSGRPRKVTDLGRRVLTQIVQKSDQRSADSITAEFQNASGINISTKTVRRELHEMGFHGRAGACKKDSAGKPPVDSTPVTSVKTEESATVSTSPVPSNNLDQVN